MDTHRVMRTVRLKRRWTQSDVIIRVRALGGRQLSLASYAFIEQGRINPRKWELIAIAAALQWKEDPKWLAYLSEDFALLQVNPKLKEVLDAKLVILDDT